MFTKVGSTWKEGVPWVRVNGVWKKAKAEWVKVDGVWKKHAYANFSIIVGYDAGTNNSGNCGYDIGKGSIMPDDVYRPGSGILDLGRILITGIDVVKIFGEWVSIGAYINKTNYPSNSDAVAGIDIELVDYGIKRSLKTSDGRPVTSGDGKFFNVDDIEEIGNIFIDHYNSKKELALNITMYIS